jgi:Flp pilus assembly protein TadG
MAREGAKMSKTSSERGATLVMVALMLVVLLSFLALVVDVGAGYIERRRIQSVADAAALAGVQVLVNSRPDGEILDAVREYALAQNPPGGNETREDPTVEWLVGTTPSGQVGSGARPSNVTGILVTVRGSTPTFFANLLGVTRVTAAAQGGGGYSPLDVMLVIDRSGSMEYNSCNFEPYFATAQPCRNLIGTYSTEYERIADVYGSCSDCRGMWVQTPTPTRAAHPTSGPSPTPVPGKCYWVDHYSNGNPVRGTPMPPVPTECATPGVTTQNNCTACRGAIVQPYQPMTSAKDAAIYFIDLVEEQLLPTVPRLGLVSYSTSATLNKTLQYAANFASVRSAIASLTPDSYTNVADGLSKALTELTGANKRATAVKAIVFMTDGQANRPGCSGADPCQAAYNAAIAVANTAAANNVPIYTIGLGSGADQALLAEIANKTNGAFLYAPTAADLHDAYGTIFDQIKRLRLVR